MRHPKRWSPPLTSAASSKAPQDLHIGSGARGRAVLLFPDEVLPLLSAVQGLFTRRGCSAFLTGGVVRDALLGRPIGDMDIAAEGDVRALAEALGQELHASVVVLDPARRIFRLVARDGGASVDLTPLRGDVAEDAGQRDFTVDALAVPLDGLDTVSGRSVVEDHVGGLEDLRRRQIRAISDGVFAADGARLLRAVRLAAELGFSIEPHTASLIQRDAHLLPGVSGERVRDELCRVLAVSGAAGHLRLLDQLGLLTRAIPELEEARDVGQPKEHYWDVLQHSFETVGALERILRLAPGDGSELDQVPWDEEMARYFHEEISGGRTRAVLLKIGALLHDVAKPATKSIEPSGRMRFLGHPRVGAEMTERILGRLRFSNREVQMLATVVREHLRLGLISRGEEGPSSRAIYRYFRDAGEVAVDTLYLSLADFLAARGPLLEPGEWPDYAGRIRGIQESWRDRQSQVRPAKLIDGHDLIKELHLEPGPIIGDLLEAVSEAQAAGEVASCQEALALAKRLLQKGAVAF